MSGTTPVALYAARVPPGGILVPAVPNATAMFRLTMAAIDPDAMPEFSEDFNSDKAPRATLKIVRPPPGMDYDDDESDDEDYEDVDSDEESDDESNGGPSDPVKHKQAKKAAALKDLEDAMDEDDDEDEGDDDDLKAAISKLIKGKGKALDDDDEGSEASSDLELEEVVVCTLDPERNYQQTIDFVVAENERIFFKVTGTHTVYLTGNYLLPLDEEDDGEDDSDDEDYGYDMAPGEDELGLMDEDDESDDLDDLANPRITEVDSDEEQTQKKSKKDNKGKNKRPAEDAAEEMDLDDMMSKAKEAEPEQKLSKKQQKKLKKNNGEAAEVKAVEAAKEAEKKAKDSPKSDKKVQFAKNLEQGPTGSTAQKDGAAGKLTVKEVQGIKIDDRKLGSGRVAKKGDRISMRYIGKLDSGKVFDSNKKGKPFSFKLGVGEVIKGWDIGVAGMTVGGERRLVIPARHAYGKSGVPGIPGNSTLTFDVKLLEIK